MVFFYIFNLLFVCLFVFSPPSNYSWIKLLICINHLFLFLFHYTSHTHTHTHTCIKNTKTPVLPTIQHLQRALYQYGICVGLLVVSCFTVSFVHSLVHFCHLS